MKVNQYESPEITVISLNEDVITGSLGIGDTPKEEFDW